MDGQPQSLWSYTLLPVGAALLIAIFVRRGLLSRASLESLPRPQTQLHALDLIPVAAMWAIGQVLASTVIVAVFGSDNVSQPAALQFKDFSDPSFMRSIVLLLAQIVAQLPLIAFAIWTFASRPVVDPERGVTKESLNQSIASRIDTGLASIGVTSPTPTIRLVARGLLGVMVALPIVFGVNQVAVGIGVLAGQPAPDSGHKLLEEFSKNASRLASISMLFSVVVVAPVLEEFVYRGMLQSCLRAAFSRRFTIVLASAIFALMHYRNVPLQVIPGLFALGCILGWLYERTGSLVPGITLHAGFNLSNILLFYLITRFGPGTTTQPAAFIP